MNVQKNNLFMAVILSFILVSTSINFTYQAKALTIPIIDGSKIYIDDINVYLSSDPHTLYSSGYVTFEFVNKVKNMDVDLAFGINTENFKAMRMQIWKNYSHKAVGWHVQNFDQTLPFNDCIDYVNLGMENYSFYDNVIGTENNSILINLTYDNGLSNQIIAFNSYTNEGSTYFFKLETCNMIDYTYENYYYDWQDVKINPLVVYYNYNNNNKWYIFQNIPTVKDQLYKIRVYLELPISLKGVTGKYSFCLKPSSETIQQAIQNDHFYELDPWFDGNYGYCKQIWIQESMIDDDLTNFPLRINRTDNDLKDHVVQADGGDIAFTTSDGVTQLYHEIVSYNTSSGQLIAHVNVTSVDSDVNTSIFMYYGNAGASDQEDVDNTWASDYILVYHFNSSTNNGANSVYDSSGYDNHGSSFGSLPTNSSPNVDTFGQFFDGTGDYVTFPSGASGFMKNGTVMFMIEHQDDNSNSHTPFQHWDNAGGIYRVPYWEIRYGDNKIYVEWKWGAGDAWYDYQVRNPTTTDQFYTATHADNDLEWYRDFISMASNAVPDSADFLSTLRYIGSNSAPGAFCIGNFYEVIISTERKTDNYIEAMSGNFRNNTFIEIGGEKTEPIPEANNPLTLTDENPANNSDSQPLSLIWNITIVDVDDDDTFNWTIHCSNTQAKSANNDGNGSKTISLVNLIYSQIYIIWINASDGMDWTNASYNFITIPFTGEGREIPIYITDVKQGADSPDEDTLPIGADGDVEVFVMSFDPTIGGNDEELFFKLHMPWNLDNDYNIQIHILWLVDDWTTGFYIWNIEYFVKNESIAYGGDYNLTTGTPFYIFENVTPLLNNQFIETEFSAGIDANVDQLIFVRLSLDKSLSNATKDAHVMMLEVKYFNISADTSVSDLMEIESSQFAIIIGMFFFCFFFYMGYKSEKRSGGGFMLVSGFMLIALEMLLGDILDIIYVIPLITPIAIFIILLGIRKQFFYVEGDKTKTEAD